MDRIQKHREDAIRVAVSTVAQMGGDPRTVMRLAVQRATQVRLNEAIRMEAMKTHHTLDDFLIKVFAAAGIEVVR